MTADDPIRARLSQMEGDDWGPGQFEMLAAIRAVLDTLDYATTDLHAEDKRGPTPQRLAHLIRQDIATALGVKP